MYSLSLEWKTKTPSLQVPFRLHLMAFSTSNSLQFAPYPTCGVAMDPVGIIVLPSRPLQSSSQIHHRPLNEYSSISTSTPLWNFPIPSLPISGPTLSGPLSSLLQPNAHRSPSRSTPLYGWQVPCTDIWFHLIFCLHLLVVLD